jgi:hypothetical protein
MWCVEGGSWKSFAGEVSPAGCHVDRVPKVVSLEVVP